MHNLAACLQEGPGGCWRARGPGLLGPGSWNKEDQGCSSGSRAKEVGGAQWAPRPQVRDKTRNRWAWNLPDQEMCSPVRPAAHATVRGELDPGVNGQEPNAALTGGVPREPEPTAVHFVCQGLCLLPGTAGQLSGVCCSCQRSLAWALWGTVGNKGSRMKASSLRGPDMAGQVPEEQIARERRRSPWTARCRGEEPLGATLKILLDLLLRVEQWVSCSVTLQPSFPVLCYHRRPTRPSA